MSGLYKTESVKSVILDHFPSKLVDETTLEYIVCSIQDNEHASVLEFHEMLQDTVKPFVEDVSDAVASEICTKIANVFKPMQVSKATTVIPQPEISKEKPKESEPIKVQKPQQQAQQSPGKISPATSPALLEPYLDYDKDIALQVLVPRIISQQSKGTLDDNININDITISVKGMDLLTNASLKLQKGRRYGLIGKNGIGKTTLLKHIAKGVLPGFPTHLSSLLVQQEVAGTELGVLETVITSDQLRTSLLKEQETILGNPQSGEEGAKRLVDIYAKLEEIESDSAEQRANDILLGLSFTKKMLSAPTNQLSGGWRMRVALACALFVKPNILLLDEPTNHLDLETVIWLQDYLQSYEGTLVVVSHDREFLQTVATDIIHFTKKRLDYYPCDFQAYEKIREEKKLKKIRLQENLNRVRDHIQDSMKKMEKAAQGNAMDQKRQNQIASRKKKLMKVGLEKTEDGKKWNCQSHGYRVGSINANGGGWKNGQRSAGSIVEAEEKGIKFYFPVPEKIGGNGLYMTLKDVSFAYNHNQNILSNVNMRIDSESRIAIVGRNGTGKSTLLGMLVGQLEPSKGELFRSPKLRIAYFTQHHVDQLNLNTTPLEHMMTAFTGSKEQEIRAHLGSFGIHGNVALQKIGSLSGGQKSRVVFAQITYLEPHILVLDEPTNHLDFDTIQALTDSIVEFEGAVVIVSHDQGLISAVATELYVVAKGYVKKFDGSFIDYRTSILSEK